MSGGTQRPVAPPLSALYRVDGFAAAPGQTAGAGRLLPGFRAWERGLPSCLACRGEKVEGEVVALAGLEEEARARLRELDRVKGWTLQAADEVAAAIRRRVGPGVTGRVSCTCGKNERGEK